MTQPFAVIFDMDGVLVDSYTPHLRTWQMLAEEHGFSISEEDFAQTFGRTSRETLADFWKDENLTDEKIAQLAQRKEKLYRDYIARQFPAMDGARELILSLHQAGVPLAVGSSGPPQNVQLVLDKLGVESLIGATVSGRDVDQGKPHPQVFLLAAQRLGLSSEQCVVIEDAPAGIQAAKAAGMTCLALVSSGRTPEQLHQADAVVGSLKEVSSESLQQRVQANLSPR